MAEAAEQSEQINVPKIYQAKSVAEFMQKNTAKLLVALERSEQRIPILDLQLDQNTSMLVGPEGGFSDNEFDQIQKGDCQTIKLGDSILKMETAALLISGIVSLKLQS